MTNYFLVILNSKEIVMSDDFLHKPGPIPWARCLPAVYTPLLRSLDNPKGPP